MYYDFGIGRGEVGNLLIDWNVQLEAPKWQYELDGGGHDMAQNKTRNKPGEG